MFEKTRVNAEVRDWFDGTGLVVKAGSATVWVKNVDGVTLGSGSSFGAAVVAAIMNAEATEENRQALGFALAVSYGPDELFAAIEDVYGDDGDEEDEEDEEDEDSGDEDSEDSEEVHVIRE